METTEERRCDFCGVGKFSLKRCSGCLLCYYCSVECQREHWQTHKQVCFSVKNNKRKRESISGDDDNRQSKLLKFSRASHIVDLPVEVITLALSFLPYKCIIDYVPLVCQVWYDLIYGSSMGNDQIAPYFWETICEKQQIWFPSASTRVLDLCKSVIPRMKPTNVSIYCANSQIAEGYLRMVEPFVKSLRIDSTSLVSVTFPENSFPHLTEVDTRSTMVFPIDHFLRTTKNTIRFAGTVENTSAVLKELEKVVMYKLKMDLILENAKTLKCIDLTSPVDYSDLYSILENCSVLQELHANTILNANFKPPHTKKAINICKLVTSDIRFVLDCFICDNLKTLEISLLQPLRLPPAQKEKLLPNLKTLILYPLDTELHESLATVLSHTNRLEQLDVTLHWRTMRAILSHEDISAKCNHLKRLRIRGSVQHESLAQLIDVSPWLSTLHLKSKIPIRMLAKSKAADRIRSLTIENSIERNDIRIITKWPSLSIFHLRCKHISTAVVTEFLSQADNSISCFSIACAANNAASNRYHLLPENYQTVAFSIIRGSMDPTDLIILAICCHNATEVKFTGNIPLRRFIPDSEFDWSSSPKSLFVNALQKYVTNAMQSERLIITSSEARDRIEKDFERLFESGESFDKWIQYHAGLREVQKLFMKYIYKNRQSYNSDSSSDDVDSDFSSSDSSDSDSN